MDNFSSPYSGYHDYHNYRDSPGRFNRHGRNDNRHSSHPNNQRSPSSPLALLPHYERQTNQRSRNAYENISIIKKYSQGDAWKVDVMATTTALIKKSDFGTAIELMNNLKEAKITPDVILYTSAISTCENGEQLNQAFQWLAEMEKEAESTPELKPNVRTYSALISACVKSKQLDKALELLQKMKDAKVKPNLITYNTLILGCGKGQRLEKALALLEEMKTAKVKPNIDTYNRLLLTCGKCQRPDKADELWQEVKDLRLTPTFFTYDAFISAHKNDPQRGVALVKEAIESGVYKKNPGYDSKNNVLNFHAPFIYKNYKPSNPNHIDGVSVSVAQALLEFHETENDLLNQYPKYIVGQHGENVVKSTILNLLKEKGYEYEVDPENEGCLIPKLSSNLRPRISEGAYKPRFQAPPRHESMEDLYSGMNYLSIAKYGKPRIPSKRSTY